MNTNKIPSIFLMVLIFSNQSFHAKSLSEIDYKAVVPAYIEHVNKTWPLQDAVNETVIAQYILAVKVPQLSLSAHNDNACFAYIESLTDVNRKTALTVAACSVLKVALEEVVENCDDEFDRSCYASLLEDTYYEFPPVCPKALDDIRHRIILFGQSFALLACL
jgi:hypothetical protein